MKYPVQIYIYRYIYIYIYTYIYIGEDQEFIIYVFYWCIPIGHEIYTKCKKTSFDHSISCVLLIDKPNECFQNSKNFEKKNHIHHKKKKLLKRKGNSITSAKTNAPISKTFSEHLKLTIQAYQMRHKELKSEAWTTSRGNMKSFFFNYC